MLEIKDLSFTRGAHEVLRKVSIQVKSGELIALHGPSGCGKTTLLRCIAFLEKAPKGSIHFDGHRVHTQHEILEFRKKVGFVPQDHGLWSLKTAIDNVTLPLTLVHGLSQQEANTRAVEMLKELEIDHKKNSYPDQLSGGEKQRLAFARALAIRPTLLLLDEPSASLDKARAVNLQEILKRERALGVSILMATHDSRYLPLFDRIYEFDHHSLTEHKGTQS